MKTRPAVAPLGRAALTLALLSFPTAAQEPAREPVDLTRVRATFAKADVDRSGYLEPGEAKRASIPTAHFALQDNDRDLRLSSEEFVTYYRQLLIAAGRPVASDLDSEAAKIQAARRVKRAGVGPAGSSVGASAGRAGAWP